MVSDRNKKDQSKIDVYISQQKKTTQNKTWDEKKYLFNEDKIVYSALIHTHTPFCTTYKIKKIKT